MKNVREYIVARGYDPRNQRVVSVLVEVSEFEDNKADFGLEGYFKPWVKDVKEVGRVQIIGDTDDLEVTYEGTL